MEAVRLFEDLNRRKPGDTRFLLGLTDALYCLQRTLHHAGRGSDALAAGERAITILGGMLQQHPAAVNVKQRLAFLCQNVSMVKADKGQSEAALRDCRRARVLYEELVRDYPDRLQYRRELSKTLFNIGSLQTRSGRSVEALASYAGARESFEQLARQNPSVVQFREDLAKTYINIAFELSRLNHPLDERKTVVTAARDLYESLSKDNPQSGEYLGRLGVCLSDLGVLLAEAGQLDDALVFLRADRDISLELVRRRPGNVMKLGDMGVACGRLAEAYARAQRFDDSVSACREALEFIAATFGPDPGAGHGWESLAETTATLIFSLQAAGHTCEATQRLADLRQSFHGDPEKLLEVSLQLSQLVAAIGGESSGSSATERAYRRLCADRVIEVIRLSVRAGLRDSGRLRQDQALIALRHRDDFRRLLMEVLDRRFPVDPFAR